MKRLILAIVVSAGLFLGVGVSVADAAVTRYSASVNVSRINGVTSGTCVVTYTIDGVAVQTLTPQQIKSLQRSGVPNPQTDCKINNIGTGQF